MPSAAVSAAVVSGARASQKTLAPSASLPFELPPSPVMVAVVPAISGKRLPASLLAFFLGGFGVHKFYLGHTSAGLWRIALLFLTCGLAGYVLPFIAWVEALIYLTKSDAEFDRLYVAGKKSWF